MKKRFTPFPIDYRKPMDFIVHDRGDKWTFNTPGGVEYTQLEPPHPGFLLNQFYFMPNKWTVTMAAQKLNITRPNLSRIVNGRAGISAKMALKLSALFGTTPQYWLNLQNNYDLWKA